MGFFMYIYIYNAPKAPGIVEENSGAGRQNDLCRGPLKKIRVFLFVFLPTYLRSNVISANSERTKHDRRARHASA